MTPLTKLIKTSTCEICFNAVGVPRTPVKYQVNLETSRKLKLWNDWLTWLLSGSEKSNFDIFWKRERFYLMVSGQYIFYFYVASVWQFVHKVFRIKCLQTFKPVSRIYLLRNQSSIAGSRVNFSLQNDAIPGSLAVDDSYMLLPPSLYFLIV